MSMSDMEWNTVANALQALPAQDKWTAQTSETYRTMLAGLSHEDAMRALGRYAMTGQTFRPTWAELLRIASGVPEDGGFASPERAWAMVHREIQRLSGGTKDPGFADRHQAAIDRLREQDECVAAWAAQRGLRGTGSLGLEEMHHEQYAGAVAKKLAAEYGDVRRLAVERLQLGQPAFTDRAFLVKGGGGGLSLGEWAEEARRRMQGAPMLEAGDDQDGQVAA